MDSKRLILDPQSKEQKEWYDQNAAHYDSHWVEPVSARVVDRWNLRNLKAVIKDVKIERALDLGCGTGKTLGELSRLGLKAVGYDISIAMLEIAKKRVCFNPLVKGDVSFLPFSSASFDLVVTNGVWHHFSDIESTIKEVARVLRPSGLFAVLGENNALYNPNNVLHRFWKYVNLPVRVSKRISKRLSFLGRSESRNGRPSHPAEPEGTEDINPLAFSNLCGQVNLREVSLYSYDHIPRMEDSRYIYPFLLNIEKVIGSRIARYEGNILQGFWVKE